MLKRWIVVAMMSWLVVGFLAPQKAVACSCVDMSVEKRYEVFDTVFLGTVLERSVIKGDNVFEVERIWKGELPNGSVNTNDAAGCGTATFEVGQQYVVYAEFLLGEMKTSVCSGNKTAVAASEDIAILNQISEHIVDPKTEQTSSDRTMYIVLGAIVLGSFVILLVRMRIHKHK
ncbi:MAG: hypothetical protein P0Y55_14930 [Candidatus Cohnella colombiensis]|uniref:Tissue inhibitor of metalloproteinase n=1 Tax=Candidatus Cohnella colombiensis TaxID=3121368 RepID=A0AA95JA07_9BACL|nr:MAG: hypothetical protein P0Y55_14930 [Cohnella sp.]